MKVKAVIIAAASALHRVEITVRAKDGTSRKEVINHNRKPL